MILLDTRALVWMVAEPKRLSRTAQSAIQNAQRSDGVCISAITLWELAALLVRGRIQAYGTVDASIRLLVEGVTVKPITPEVATLAIQFPEDFSRDPADRLIGATSRAEGMKLITKDEKMHKSRLLNIVW